MIMINVMSRMVQDDFGKTMDISTNEAPSSGLAKMTKAKSILNTNHTEELVK